MNATQADISRLEKLYEGRIPYQGELHDHSNSGGGSDGHYTLAEWKQALAEKEIDFATIVDHRGLQHMYLPDWDPTIFIGGSEPGTIILDQRNPDGTGGGMHYNMIFAEPEPLWEIIDDFPEFKHTDGIKGRFVYPRFTTKRFTELVERILAAGGFFVNPHPSSCKPVETTDPLYYWFVDKTALEVIYTYRSDRDGLRTQQNYKLWNDLLALGKVVYATAGNDEHRLPSDKALSTIYAAEKHSKDFVNRLRDGDFTAGPVGIRMCIGDTKMGGFTPFAGKRLVVGIEHFHKCVYDPEHTFRMELHSDKGLEESCHISCDKPFFFAIDAQDRAYYRVEIFDETLNSRIALGNPIWNR